MPFCKFFPILLLFNFTLFHHTVSETGELAHFCSISGNYTTNNTYETNLVELLTNLTNEVPSNGFAMGSKGEGINRTHGLALCRGDLSPTDCGNCVVRAVNDTHKLCPYNKGAQVWYENCTVRYSNYDFFGQIVNDVLLCWASPENVTDPVAKPFVEKIQEFLRGISQEAVMDPKFYGYGKSDLDEFNTAFGLAQCTRDLSAMDCEKCLNLSINFLPQCGKEKEGMRLYSDNCRVRYELYPFLKIDEYSVPPSSPSPLPSPAPDDAVSPLPPPEASAHGLDPGILIDILIGLSSLFLTHYVIQHV